MICGTEHNKGFIREPGPDVQWNHGRVDRTSCLPGCRVPEAAKADEQGMLTRLACCQVNPCCSQQIAATIGTARGAVVA